MLHGPQACSMVYAEFFLGGNNKNLLSNKRFFQPHKHLSDANMHKNRGGGKKGIFSLFAFFIILYLQRRLTAIERAAIYQ